MMNQIITIIALVSFVLITVAFFCLYRERKCYHDQRQTSLNIATRDLISKFISSDDKSEVSSCFGALAERGYFNSLRTGNHGKELDDTRQLKDFSKNMNNPDIISALMRVGNKYE